MKLEQTLVQESRSLPAQRLSAILLVTSLCLLALFLVLWLGSSQGPRLGTRPADDAVLPDTVSIVARNMDVRQVLVAFAGQLRAEPRIDPRIHGTLSIETSNSKLSAVMPDLCTAVKCTWSLKSIEGRRVLEVTARN